MKIYRMLDHHLIHEISDVDSKDPEAYLKARKQILEALSGRLSQQDMTEEGQVPVLVNGGLYQGFLWARIQMCRPTEVMPRAFPAVSFDFRTKAEE